MDTQDDRIPVPLLTGVVGRARDIDKQELRDRLNVPVLQPKKVVAAANALIPESAEMAF